MAKEPAHGNAPRRVIDLIAELARRPGDDALRQPMCFFFWKNELGILGEEIF
jgi:hypothetical protein